MLLFAYSSLQKSLVVVLDHGNEFLAKQFSDSVEGFKLLYADDGEGVLLDADDCGVVDKCFAFHTDAFVL